MEEKLVDLEHCEPGNVVTREIIDLKTGAILCSKGQILTEDKIKWLGYFKYTNIYIQAYNLWGVSVENYKVYQENKQRIDGIIKNLKHTRKLDTKALEEVKKLFNEELGDYTRILGCINIVKDLDEYLYAHSMNVGMLAALIGRWMKLDEDMINDLFVAGVLHDVGKCRVEPTILNKKTKLTNSEFDEIKKHVIYGYDLLKDETVINANVKVGVLTHHERIDGKGYPRGLKMNEIPLIGKILGIADTYDAIISNRIHIQRKTPFETMEIMRKESVGCLDTEVLFVFLDHIAQYYIGVNVVLNTGQEGRVIFIPSHMPHCPIVEVGDSYIDLSTNKAVKIVDVK